MPKLLRCQTTRLTEIAVGVEQKSLTAARLAGAVVLALAPTTLAIEAQWNRSYRELPIYLIVARDLATAQTLTKYLAVGPINGLSQSGCLMLRPIEQRLEITRLLQLGLAISAILLSSRNSHAFGTTSACVGQFAAETFRIEWVDSPHIGAAKLQRDSSELWRSVAIQESDDQELLKQVKQAVSTPEKAWEATMVSGKAVQGGVEHAYSFAFLPDGRFVQIFQGSDSKTFGNDGSQYWQEDRAHFVQDLEFGDRDRQMAINLLLSGNWLSALAPIKLAEGENVIHALFKESGVALDIHIDPSTYLPTEASFQIPNGTTLKMSDWRVAGDRLVPMLAEITTEGETETYSAKEVKPIDPDDVSTAKPKPNVTDTSFEPAKPATVEASFAGKTHIKVRALVNGQDVGWFILDSGAGAMVIDKALADSLKLESVSKGMATGVGGQVEVNARAVEKFEIGPMTLHNVRFGDYDFSSFNTGTGPRIAGIIGTPIFRRAVVAMNWNGPKVEIYDRTKFSLEKGDWQNLRFSSGVPVILARAANTPESWYRVDSGGRGSLTLHTPFVEKWKLLEGRETTESSSSGLGGTVAARLGTIPWFELGSHRFDNPAVIFSTTNVGGFTDPYTAGYIGIDILKQFTVVMDFTGSRVAFVK